MKLNWTFLGGEGVQNKKPSMGGGGGGREYTYIFSGTTHSHNANFDRVNKQT